MIAWILLSVLITAEVSRAAGKCFRNEFEGKLSSTEPVRGRHLVTQIKSDFCCFLYLICC